MKTNDGVVHHEVEDYPVEAMRVLINELYRFAVENLSQICSRAPVVSMPSMDECISAQDVALEVWQRLLRDEERMQEIVSTFTVKNACTNDDAVFGMLGQYIYAAIRRAMRDVLQRKARHQREANVGEGHVAVIVNCTPDEIDEELTTEEAAKLLKVSRPHVAKLVDTGKLSARMVGWLRKLSKREVLAYKENAQRKARKSVQKVVQMVEAEEADSHQLEAGVGSTVVRGEGV